MRWGFLIIYYLIISALPSSIGNEEKNIFSESWDVLIILDACTMPLMRNIESDWEFLSNSGSIFSVGSSSYEFMEKTFTDEYSSEMKDTIYVTGNPHSEMLLSSSDFYLLDEVWEYAWDSKAGTIPARPITDRAIKHSREKDPDRMIVHYMQPHFPSMVSNKMGSKIHPDDAGEVWTGSVWDKLREGEIAEENVRTAYQENLNYVLEDLDLLLENMDADKVIITSDHGNSFGEFGMFGHHGYTPLTSLRKVPWYATKATDEKRHDPTDYEYNESDAQDRLEALGYV